MDIRRVEQMEREEHSKETLNLTKRLKELVKPGEHRTSNTAWKKYNPPRHHRAETKRIEMTLNQRRNRMLWDRMEEQDRETEKETERRNELHRVIEKIRKMPQKQEKQLETSREIQEQEDSPEAETESTTSIESLGVRNKFQKIHGSNRCPIQSNGTSQPCARRKQMGFRRDNLTSGTKICNRPENNRQRNNQ